MILGVVIGPFLLKSPLADAPQVYRYTLPITELGTEIMALMSHYRFNCATIVTDSATECYEICLPHTYILGSFALFFYSFLILICIYNSVLQKSGVKMPDWHKSFSFAFGLILKIPLQTKKRKRLYRKASKT